MKVPSAATLPAAPSETDHTTPTLLVPSTVAAMRMDWPIPTVAVLGFTVMEMMGAAGSWTACAAATGDGDRSTENGDEPAEIVHLAIPR